MYRKVHNIEVVSVYNRLDGFFFTFHVEINIQSESTQTMAARNNLFIKTKLKNKL